MDNEGEFYHIYNRGTEKRDVFLDKADYHRFLSLLYVANSPERVELRSQGRTLSTILERSRSQTLVHICAYCLMPNHFHLLIQSKGNKLDSAKFMQKLITAYSMYFNKKYDRSGALFQGRYKAKHLNTDVYLKYMIAYIHLNPVSLIEPNWQEKQIWNREEGKEFLQQYTYSSFLDFLEEERLQAKIVDKTALPQYFETPQNFLSSMHEWMHYQG